MFFNLAGHWFRVHCSSRSTWWPTGGRCSTSLQYCTPCLRSTPCWTVPT